MRIRHGLNVEQGNRVIIASDSIYKGESGYIEEIIKQRGNRHDSALVVLDCRPTVTALPFLASELSRRV